MTMLNAQLGVPLHHQISNVIREGIACGRHFPGEQLPTEDQLCKAFAVSRITVRRAMQALAEEGLVSRRQGRGTFINDSAQVASLTARMDVFQAGVNRRREHMHPVVEQYGLVEPPPRVAVSLALAAGEKAFCVTRMQMLKKQPVLYSVVHLPQAFAERLPRAAFETLAFTQVMEQAGIQYDRVDVVASATLADTSLATRLKVSVGAPLVQVHRLGFGVDGIPIEHQLILGSPERYDFRITLGT